MKAACGGLMGRKIPPGGGSPAWGEAMGTSKMLPPLLSSHQGKCSTIHAGRWLLDTIFHVLVREALESVSVWVCAGRETRAGHM